MTRDLIPLSIKDVSLFTKALRADLLARDTIPGHATLLSMVSKAAGFDNHQHLKATAPAKPDPKLTKALRAFDQNGIMAHWPKQTTVQGLCLAVFWAQLPANTDLSEKDINTVLIGGHSFGDHPLLRRSLIDHRLVTRTIDGRIYRRVERAPTDGATTLIADIKQRRATAL